jgi:AraC family transcriptional regulator
MVYFYFESSKVDIVADRAVPDTLFTPLFFFENTRLWDPEQKLKRSIESTSGEIQLYFETIGTILEHELVDLVRGAVTKNESYMRGDPPKHQQWIVASYIEEHLSEQISVPTLAQLAHLSPFHFCRVFKQRFGSTAAISHFPADRICQDAACEAQTFDYQDRGRPRLQRNQLILAVFRKVIGVNPSAYRMSFVLALSRERFEGLASWTSSSEFESSSSRCSIAHIAQASVSEQHGELAPLAAQQDQARAQGVHSEHQIRP